MSQIVADLNKDTPNSLHMQIMNGKNSNGSILNNSLVVDNTKLESWKRLDQITIPC